MTCQPTYNKLFVVGYPRSGTTWLSRLLAQHPDTLVVVGESHIYRLVYEPFTYIPKIKLKQRLKRWPEFIRYYGLKALLFGASSQDIWNSILRSYRFYKRKGDVGLHRLLSYQTLKTLIQQARLEPASDLNQAQILIRLALNSFFETAGGKPHQILLEKTPFHIKHVDVILRAFPEAKVLHIIRDGRDVCASLQARSKTQKWSRYDTQSIIQQWEKCIRLGKKFGVDSDLQARIYSVKYEDLRENTLIELQKVYDFVGLSASQQEIKKIIDALDIKNMSDKGEGQHIYKGAVGNWRKALSESDIQLWHGSSASQTLRELGYAIDEDCGFGDSGARD